MRVRLFTAGSLLAMLLGFGMWGGVGRFVMPARADVVSNYQGFDGCQWNGSSYQQPTTGQMQVWWNSSPFWQYYVYVGGMNALCGGAGSGLSSSWFSTVRSQGWGLVGIWVGPQCCGSPPYYISTNTTTAYNQGASEAQAAYSALFNFDQVNGNFPMVYDFESNSNVAAVNAFLGGWVQQWHNSGFLWAGAYGSVCGSQVSSWVNASPVPDFVWTADYQNPLRNTVWGLQCLADGYWYYDQRHNQYHGTHPSSWGGVSLSIDASCGNGQVFAAPGFSYGDSESSEGGGASEDSYWCSGGVL